LPTSCHVYSSTEYGEEEVHVAYIALAYDEIPTVTQAELSFEPLFPVLVQSARHLICWSNRLWDLEVTGL
jgi:hypothetical protein